MTEQMWREEWQQYMKAMQSFRTADMTLQERREEEALLKEWRRYLDIWAKRLLAQRS